MGTFERFLTLWVALCIVAGIVFGQLAPGAFRAIGEAAVAEVRGGSVSRYSVSVPIGGFSAG